MATEDAEEHFVNLIDAAIAQVAEQARDNRECTLLIAELQAIKQRVHSRRPAQERRETAAPRIDRSGRRH